ncbi:MAG: RNA methyltransferase [Clostridia bacterium]|nr:RNA methyltransferase [Clostridia bacterium]
MRYCEPVIQSRQNEKVTALYKLKDKKYRDESGLFRFDGIKLLKEALSKDVTVRSLFVRQGTELPPDVEGKLEQKGIRTYVLSSDLFDRISDEKAPEGVITTAEYIDNRINRAIIKEEEKIQDALSGRSPDAPILLLESIQDPLNFGALIRSAVAFGAALVVTDDASADPYHPKALRASMGAMFSIPIVRVSALAEAVRILTLSRRVFAAALDEKAKELGSFERLPGDSLIIGNEGHGLSADVLDAASETLLIPMSGETESLNASVAGGILLWEFRRR